MSTYNYIQEVDKAIEILQSGGVILYPTDTIWGLGCDATNPDAIEKIYSIKNRPENKSCIVLFPTLKEALKYTAHPPEILYDLVAEYKNQPTTFIIDHAIGLAEGAANVDNSMAFRIPQHRFCTQLLKKFGKPIISTSANVSGAPSPNYFTDISEVITSQVDYTVNPDMPDTSTHQASRIIRVYPDNTTDIIR